ncbi:MAG: hypothetical protein OQK54_07345 [Gammaproteobacteria bacterium]|nr:hypothetical protein [Gammaproteobacteria bacterium]
MATEITPTDGKRLAIAAEALYLANLLVLPLLAFLLLWWLYSRQGAGAPPLAAAHLQQSVVASLWAGLLLIPLPLLTLILSGGSLTGWTVAILWFVTCHAALVLAGAVGLARAMAGKPWRYPLIGGGKS